jgi:hypothetical protein
MTIRLRSVIRVFCIALIVVSNLLAIMFDLAVLRRRGNDGRGTVPGDFASFRLDAMAVLHHLPADYLPYPPPFLLLSTPFSLVPPLPGYIAWVFAGLFSLIAVTYGLSFRLGAIIMGLVSVPTLYCIVMGQTGLFVSAALLLSLGLAEAQPVIAGIAAGCVIIKPQFGLLLPVCFLAARNWRAFAAAAATVGVLCLLSGLIFGLDVWSVFFPHHVSGAQSLLAAPWPSAFEYTMITVFMLCRSLGASAHAAAIFQALACICAAFACWRLWLPGRSAGLGRTAAMLCLIMLATPYAYIYDLPALAFVLAEYAARHRPAGLAVMALFWFFTGAYPLFSTFWFLPGAIFITLILLMLRWPRQRSA